MSEPAGEWRPAFPGQRPPFRPGNVTAVTHGAFTPRLVDPRAAELVDAVLGESDVGYLRAPSYRPALWAWARAETQVERLTAHLAERDFDDPDALPARTQLERAERRAAAARSRLGMDPLSRARLGKDVASARVDVANYLSDLREQRDAEQAERQAESADADRPGDEPEAER